VSAANRLPRTDGITEQYIIWLHKSHVYDVKKNTKCGKILCFVDRASRYISVMKINMMHYLSSVYFVSQPLHVSGISVAHHREVYCICTVGTCCAFQLTVCWLGWDGTRTTVNWKATIRTNSIFPDDGLQICPKHVEVDWWNKLEDK